MLRNKFMFLHQFKLNSCSLPMPIIINKRQNVGAGQPDGGDCTVRRWGLDSQTVGAGQSDGGGLDSQTVGDWTVRWWDAGQSDGEGLDSQMVRDWAFRWWDAGQSYGEVGQLDGGGWTVRRWGWTVRRWGRTVRRWRSDSWMIGSQGRLTSVCQTIAGRPVESSDSRQSDGQLAGQRLSA